MNQAIHLWKTQPIVVIAVVAIATRLLAVVFAGGYGYHDDHFLVIEPAQGWVEGQDVNNWLIDRYEESTSGRSLLYPGVHYLLFAGLEAIGIASPAVKMALARLILAAYSLLIVVYGYRLVRLVASPSQANFVGLLLATYWMLPQISVRNLVEVAPIPLMLIASYWVVQHTRKLKPITVLFWAGILFGFCFSLRYQTLFFSGGIGLGYLLLRQWKATLWLVLGTLLPIVLIHGVGDWLATGLPFGKVWYYIEYNILYSNAYSTEPWYTYLLILAGVFIPPVSLFLLFGFAISYRVNFPVWLGVLLFLMFHSLFPNKQERFIFTIIPHLLVFGYLGWQQFLTRSPRWQSYRLFRRGSWVFFWVINLIMVVIYSTYYNKQARIEGMQYLAKQGDTQALLMVDLQRNNVKPPPLFYLEKRVPVYDLHQDSDWQVMRDSLYRLPQPAFPNYAVVMQKQGQDISDTPEQLKALFAEVDYEATFTMSTVDRVRNRLNRSIKLDDWVIYRVKPYPASEIDG